VARTGPPAYAWDWFARQRLLWRDARRRLAASSTPAATRYAAVDTRAETMALLRADYGRDAVVRAAIDATVRELVFLGRTDVPFARLGLRSAPRGQRWWWSALTGEELDAAPARHAPPASQQLSLDELAGTDLERALDDVAQGFGDQRFTDQEFRDQQFGDQGFGDP
jgi:hypothetical protein